MLPKTAILIATHNRKTLVERAIPSVVRARDYAVSAGDLEAADIWIYDDGSSQYGGDWLRELSSGGFVETFPRQAPGAPRRSVALIREMLFRDAIEFDDYELFLHLDSDMYVDPASFAHLDYLIQDCPKWGVISLFNPIQKDWEAKSKTVGWAQGKDWYRYGIGGGIMLTRRPTPDQMPYLTVKPGLSWDGYWTGKLGDGMAVISRESFVEHLGGGIHEGKPARNPTEWLKKQLLFS